MPHNEAKMILVGRGSSGKTSIVNRLLHDTFDPQEPETHGIFISPWELAIGGESFHPDDLDPLRP